MARKTGARCEVALCLTGGGKGKGTHVGRDHTSLGAKIWLTRIQYTCQPGSVHMHLHLPRVRCIPVSTVQEPRQPVERWVTEGEGSRCGVFPSCWLPPLD